VQLDNTKYVKETYPLRYRTFYIDINPTHMAWASNVKTGLQSSSGQIKV